MNTKNAEDNRRYKRIYLPSDVYEAPQISNASAEWPRGAKSFLYDISYSGAALSAPREGLLTIESGQIMPLKLSLGDQASFSAHVKVIRVTSEIVGVNFEELPTDGHRAIEKFLQIKLIGAYMRLVDPKLYSPEQTFHFWYHGPKDTNIFIWTLHEALEKFSIELDFEVLFWNRGRFSLGHSHPTLRRLTEDYTYFINFESPQKPFENNGSVPQKFFDLVSYITPGATETEKDFLTEIVRVLGENLPKKKK